MWSNVDSARSRITFIAHIQPYKQSHIHNMSHCINTFKTDTYLINEQKKHVYAEHVQIRIEQTLKKKWRKTHKHTNTQFSYGKRVAFEMDQNIHKEHSKLIYLI